MARPQGENQVSLLAFLQDSDTLLNRIKSLTPQQLEATNESLEVIACPTQNDQCLKIAFWQEYKRAQSEKRKMIVPNIYQDILSQKGWGKKLTNPDFVAWLIHPPQSEYLLQLHLIDLGMKRLAEALRLDFTETKHIRAGCDKNGDPKFIVQKKINVSLIKEVRGIVEMLQDRAYGSVLHRQANMNISAAAPDNTISLENIDEIEEKLEKLKRVKAMALELGPSDDEVFDAEEVNSETD